MSDNFYKSSVIWITLGIIICFFVFCVYWYCMKINNWVEYRNQLEEQQMKIEQDKLEIQRKMLNAIIEVKNSIDNQECEVKLTY